MVVNRAGHGLEQEDVLLPDVLEDPDERLIVAELEDLATSALDAKVRAYVLCQGGVGVTGKHLQVFVEWHCLGAGPRLAPTVFG